ncbi:hypothetical protein [Candidatus Amarolinea dominans]|uniref:hypothetical protein n=1 Tax=Candidatus Amarolinea dominans TaxID=3140696 RepID=UPI0031CCB5A6
MSVLDGWWAEGYDGRNGWSIGEERMYKDEATQDAADALSLYTTLEDEVVPAYYQRRRWYFSSLAEHHAGLDEQCWLALQHGAHDQRVHHRHVRAGAS